MDTRVMKLCCQGCGADLQVTEDVRFVTCNYCQSKLEIVRDASVTHTRVLEKLERTTERIAGNLKVIELQNDLERLDREWESERSSMMVRGENGQVSAPSTAASVIGGIFAIGFGIFFMVSTSFMGLSLFSVFGLIFAGIGIFNLIQGSAKASKFRNAQYDHHMRRNRLIRAIEQERRR